MSHFVEGNFKTFRVGAADIPAGTAVKLTAGLLVAAAAATDKIIGVVEAKGYLTKLIDVHLRSAAGTISIVAGGTIAAGDAVTSNASGLGVATTTTGDQIIGYAIEAGTAGKTVELIPSNGKF